MYQLGLGPQENYYPYYPLTKTTKQPRRHPLPQRSNLSQEREMQTEEDIERGDSQNAKGIAVIL